MHKVCLAFIIIKGAVTLTSHGLPCLNSWAIYITGINETQHTFSKRNEAVKHWCLANSLFYMLISLRACSFQNLIKLWSPKFKMQMLFFPPASRLVKPLDKCGSSFSLLLGRPLITYMPVPQIFTERPMSQQSKGYALSFLQS